MADVSTEELRALLDGATHTNSDDLTVLMGYSRSLAREVIALRALADKPGGEG